jgi:hypothetical protein
MDFWSVLDPSISQSHLSNGGVLRVGLNYPTTTTRWAREILNVQIQAVLARAFDHCGGLHDASEQGSRRQGRRIRLAVSH